MSMLVIDKSTSATHLINVTLLAAIRQFEVRYLHAKENVLRFRFPHHDLVQRIHHVWVLLSCGTSAHVAKAVGLSFCSLGGIPWGAAAQVAAGSSPRG